MSDQSIQMWQGDCLELMHRIPDGSVDAIIADLPYGTTACKWDSVIPFEPLWAHCKRVIKKNGAVVLFGSQPFTSALVMSNPKWFRYSLVWDKVNQNTGSLNANKMPLRRHEDLLVFYRALPTYNPQWQQRPPMTNSGSGNHAKCYNTATPVKRGKKRDVTHPCSLIPINGHATGNHSHHPTQKPVALLEYLIRTYTNPGETVLDNTMGSGTTLVAAVNTGRCGIGIERDAAYFEIAQKRVADAQAAKFLSLFAVEEIAA